MKQLPRISSLLYGTPWAIRPEAHAELSALYQGYLRGTLPPRASMPGFTETETENGLELNVDPLNGIAVLSGSGVIGKRIPTPECGGPTVIDLAEMDMLLDQVAADDSVQTLVLDLATPGGTTIGLIETGTKIREISKIKRTVCYTDTELCSAGYFLACACDEIYAAPSAIVGCIGTYVAGIDDSRQWEMEGLKLILAKSGSMKAMGHPGKQWTEEEVTFLQETADTAGEQFRTWVREARGAVSDDLMQGQWFTASAAVGPLVDALYPDLPALLMELAFTP